MLIYYPYRKIYMSKMLCRCLNKLLYTQPLCKTWIQRVRTVSQSASAHVKYLSRDDESCTLAYRALGGRRSPGIVFCHGFQSNMESPKALLLEKYCLKEALPFVRFDLSGCGQSGGKLSECLFTDWKKDLCTVIDRLTSGPLVLVGYDVGAWLCIHAMLDRPHRVQGLLCIAPAPDLGTRIINAVPQEVRDEIHESGQVTLLSSTDEEKLITQAMLEDMEKYNIIDSDTPLPTTAPIRIVHGTGDVEVGCDVVLAMVDNLGSADIRLSLTKTHQHHLPGELANKLIIRELKDVCSVSAFAYENYTGDVQVARERIQVYGGRPWAKRLYSYNRDTTLME